jgi:hypothetical protein
LNALFFNTLVVVFDGGFVHRSRTIEKKDGRPLNEVRMMCNVIMQNGGVLTADKSINDNPAKSALKSAIGDGCNASCRGLIARSSRR